MNSDPQNFESLRRLLAWKRHERPHSRFFNDFSAQVIARIEAGEKVKDAPLLEGLFGGAPGWLQRLWAGLEAKPLMAGGVGLAACAALVVGIVCSENVPPSTADVPESPASPIALLTGHQIVTPMPEQRATLVSFPSMNGMPTSRNRSLFEEFQHTQNQYGQRQDWQLISSPGGN